jgi:hypothetical protein
MFCAHEPYETYSRIEPCKALAETLTKRLDGIEGMEAMKGVCFPNGREFRE